MPCCRPPCTHRFAPAVTTYACRALAPPARGFREPPQQFNVAARFWDHPRPPPALPPQPISPSHPLHTRRQSRCRGRLASSRVQVALAAAASSLQDAVDTPRDVVSIPPAWRSIQAAAAAAPQAIEPAAFTPTAAAPSAPAPPAAAPGTRPEHRVRSTAYGSGWDEAMLLLFVRSCACDRRRGLDRRLDLRWLCCAPQLCACCRVCACGSRLSFPVCLSELPCGRKILCRAFSSCPPLEFAPLRPSPLPRGAPISRASLRVTLSLEVLWEPRWRLHA